MAIVQISQITNRLGLAQDLPQLAGGELGWSTDTRQLYIGNGTLVEGAPVIGNTEILTEFSDILNVAAAYTYKGTAAGYTVQTGPTPGTPIVQSLQNWMDQYASVKDFGATGDGVTDDTDAINRALYQLYCRGTNTQTRRTLFFPAGTYVVSSTINIPTYATLIGDGYNSSFIQLKTGTPSSVTHVAQTADSLQQTSINIGNGGAIRPSYISISHLAFQSLDTSKNIFLVRSAIKCEFNGVSFSGVTPTSSLTTNGLATSCLHFGSTDSLITSDITFTNCRFYGTVYGVFTLYQTEGVVITNSTFDTLYQGVMLGVGSSYNGGPSGTRITSNVFDNIYEAGIVFGAYLTSGLNASGYNIFYDVGDSFGGVTNPTASIIRIESSNNVSIGDMFERSNLYATTYPQVETGDSYGAILNNNGLIVGSKTIQSGLQAILADNEIGATAFTVNVGLNASASVSPITSFKIDYNIVQGTKYRTGTCMIASQGGGIVTFTDDYNENSTINVYLYAEQAGNYVNFNYNTTPPSGVTNTYLYYSVSYLN